MATPSAKDMLMQVRRYAEGGTVQSDGLIRALERGLTEDQYYANIRDYATKNTNPLEALNAMTAGGVSMADANRALGTKAVSDYFTIDANQGEKAPSNAVATNYVSPLQQGWIDTPNHGQAALDARIREVAQQNPNNPEALRNLFVQERANIADLQRAGVDPSILYATVAQKPTLPTLPVIPPYTPPRVTPETQIQYPQPTPYTATPVYQPLAAPPPIYGAGQPALDVNFRNSAPRTYDPRYGYVYTPAASLLPATGAGMSWTPPSVTSRPRSLLKVPLATAANPQYSASQQFARDRAAAQLAALPVGGGGRFSGMQATPAPPIDNTTPNPYAVAPEEFRFYAPKVAADGGEIKKSEGTADLSARAMLDTIDSDVPVKRNMVLEAHNASRARAGMAPAVPQDYSGRDLTGELLNALSLATTPLPVLPDVAGLAADYRMYQTKPEERTMGNYLLSAAGVLPLVPSVSAVKTAGKGVKTAAEELAALTAKAPTSDIQKLISQVNPSYMDDWTRNADLPEDVVANYWKLGDEQRGIPETAMVQAQRTLGGGVVAESIEHVGDLTNRMTPKHSLGFAYESTLGKAKDSLASLKSKYGFRKEHEGNLRSNAAYDNVPYEEYKAKADAALLNYANAHRALAVYNPLQRLARDTSVALGEQRFEDAATLLDEFVTRIPTQEAFIKEMKVDLAPLAAKAPPASVVQTDTPEFKNFFGESKVVDAKGNPMPVYHGTSSDFTVFRPSESGLLGRGIYLSSEERVAKGFRGADKLMRSYVSMKNPAYEHDLIPKRLGDKMKHDEYQKELHDRAIDGGFDGIIKGGSTDVFGNPRTPDSWGNFVVFKPTQIKSATSNSGTFDLSNPDINKADGGPIQKYATGSEVSSPKQTIEAIEPSLRDTIQQFIYDKMGGASSPEARARALRYQNVANNVMDWTPGLSTEVARSDAEADYNQGNYGKAALGMALAGLDVIPGAGKVTKVAAKELSNLTGAAAEAMSPIVLRGSKKESPAATALTQIEEQFKRNPFDDREVVGDGAAATLYTTGDDSLHLSDIRTLDPGKGNSSRLLSQILAITDKNKVDVDLIAEAYNKGLSTEQLRDWYARNGFEALEQDPDTMLRMYDRAAGKGPLDKTLEARMARAAEQGYTGPLYHGTADIENEGFDEFNKKFYGSVTNSPSAKMGTWLTDDPQTANIYASFAPFSTLQGLQDKYQSTAEKLWRKSGMLEGEARTAAREKDKLKLAPLADKIKQATEALEAGVPDPAEARKFFPLPTRIGGGGGANIMPVRARGNFMEYDAANTSIRELRDKKGLTKLAKEAREGGYDGLKITNFSDPLSAPHATHYLVFDTKNIRSEYADYDPSKLESSNLGHAKGGLIQKYATGSEVSSNTADLIAQMNAVGNMSNNKTPDPAPTREQTESRNMLERLDAASAVEQEVYKMNGMEPGLDRASILPFAGSRKQGNLQFAAPQMLYDLAKAGVAPGVAASGRQVSNEDALNTALNITGGSFGASHLAGPAAEAGKTVLGMAVKNKGGNWLKGTIEEVLSPLKSSPVDGETPAQTISYLEDWIQQPRPSGGLSPLGPITQERLDNASAHIQTLKKTLAVDNWVDRTVGNYVKNEMGTPEDPVRVFLDAWPAKRDAQLAQKQSKIDKLLIKRETADSRVAAYIDRDIAAIKDEMTSINEYNPLHFTLPYIAAPSQIGVAAKELAKFRKEQGFPAEGMGKGDIAKQWEQITDTAISVYPMLDINLEFTAETRAANPWLLTSTPKTKVYDASYGAPAINQDLGFDHLVDELRNSIRADSGLPPELQLTPEQLNSMSMPQAVERVAKINQWRKDNIRKLKLEETLKADLYKDYPEQGSRWVQLNRKGQFAAESDAMGHSVRGYEPTPQGGSTPYGIDNGGWGAIQSGRAKVYSLRDSKGQPKATFEVKSGRPMVNFNSTNDRVFAFEQMPEAAQKKYAQQFNDEFGAGVSDDDDFGAWLQKEEPEFYAKITTPQLPSLTQMKGPNNQPVDEAFWKEAQDFVRSGNWENVESRDLSNIGLYQVNVSSVANDYLTQPIIDYGIRHAAEYPTLTRNDMVLMAAAMRRSPTTPKYVNEEELAALFNKYAPTVVSKAKGGSVTKKAKGGNVERVYNDRKYI